MKHKLLSAMLLVGSTFLIQPVLAADDNAAVVNGKAIKRSWVEAIKKQVQDRGGKPNEQAIIDRLIANELLAQEASRLGIDKRPELVAQLEMQSRELLAAKLVEETVSKTTVSDDMVKAEYEAYKKSLGDTEYSARHIQVKTQAEAQDVIAQLAKGADFAKLAKDKSIDQRTKDNGGSLGWFSKNRVTPPLGAAASMLQKGLYTTMPLQSRGGWHVLKLDDTRPLQAPAFDKVKAQLKTSLQRRQVAKLSDELRKKAKIEQPK